MARGSKGVEERGGKFSTKFTGLPSGPGRERGEGASGIVFC